MCSYIRHSLDKNNLHHAYLIEGAKEEVVPEILEFLKDIKVKIEGNPDFCYISVDSFRMEDARNLKSLGVESGFSPNKRVFLICANNFLLEAQNSLLKLFEEPTANTYFFINVPDKNSLLRTLVSRFYVIGKSMGVTNNTKEAEKFMNMPLKARIDFLKALLSVSEEDEETNLGDSPRSIALGFLNMIEQVLHVKLFGEKYKTMESPEVFKQIFKVRRYLRQPGSSTKSLMESVALSVPYF